MTTTDGQEPAAGASPTPAVAPRTLAVLLAAVTAAAWSASIRNGFVFDDLANIQGNPWIKDWTLLPQAFAHQVAGFDANYTTSFYRPLMHVWYALAYALAGERPWAFHLLNVALHVVAVLAAFTLLRRVVGRYCPHGRFDFVPQAAALVFALHPVHAEPVLWVAGITDVSCAALGLLALVAYVRAFDAPRAATVAALALFASLLCKETGASIFALMVVLEWIERGAGARWTLRAAAVRLAGPGVAVAMYLALRWWALGSFAPSASAHPHGPVDLAASAAELLVRYLGLLVAPVALSAARDVRPAGDFSSPFALAGLAVGAAMVAAAVRWRRSPLLLLALGAIVLPLLPALYLPAIEGGSSVVGERYLYLPVLGLGIAVGVAVEAIARRPRWGRMAAVGVLLGLSGWGVISALAMTRVWADSLTLWSDAVSKAPGSAAAHEGLCFALYQQGRVSEALDACGRALAIEPGRVDALTNHATALLALGRPAQAKRELDEVLASHPRSPEALVSRGLACMMLGAHDEALVSYRRAVAMAPLNAEAHNVLGVALARLGRPVEALPEIETAVRLAPGNPEYRANLEALRPRGGPM